MISQMELIAAICKELARQGVESLCPRQTNAIIRAANAMIAECERAPVMASPGMGLGAWLASDDVGLSSRYMAGVLSGQFSPAYAHPADSSDFGRCMRLLEAVPELRGKLDLMRDKSPEWSELVANWDRIESMVKAKDARRASKLVMDSVQRPN